MKVLMTVLICVVALMSASLAAAKGRPEYDAVGADQENYFNDERSELIVENGLDGYLRKINNYSDFSDELFANTAGMLYPDPCFPGYISSMVACWTEATYTWQIVLQMQPESDLHLSIAHCVMDYDEDSLWSTPAETGRAISTTGAPVFFLNANPSITVTAYPGPYATPGFTSPFHMEAYLVPRLTTTVMDDALLIGMAPWESELVLVQPKTGKKNSLLETTYNLKMGDYIKVEIAIPYNSPVNIRYGKDSVIVSYIGTVGTEYSTASSQ